VAGRWQEFVRRKRRVRSASRSLALSGETASSLTIAMVGVVSAKRTRQWQRRDRPLTRRRTSDSPRRRRPGRRPPDESYSDITIALPRSPSCSLNVSSDIGSAYANGRLCAPARAPWIRRRARPRWREPLRSPRAPSARVATWLTAGFRRERNPSWLAPDRTRRPVFRGCSSLARPGQSAQIPQTRQRRRRRGRRLLLRGSSSHGACWKPAPGTPSKQFGRVGGVAALHQ
jgi:hypothetical protein